jgi:hypothetical protein
MNNDNQIISTIVGFIKGEKVPEIKMEVDITSKSIGIMAVALMAVFTGLIIMFKLALDSSLKKYAQRMGRY